MSAPGRKITTPIGVALDSYRLNYRGDVTENFPGTLLGPNTRGEYVVVVSADYDHEIDKTRVGVRFATAEDLRTAVPL